VTNSNSGGGTLAATGDVDPAARRLAVRIGGQPSVSIPGFGNREFDAVSDRYVAQTTSAASASLRPSNFLTPARRRQIRETLRAAQATGREALFEFTGGAPAPAVVDFIERNSRRIGVGMQIDVRQVSSP
jgi:hypothetical protein